MRYALLRALLAALPLTLPAQTPAPDAQDPGFREQTIYIPYEKLWKVFEQQGRGVFLPYEEFNRLWAAARSNLNTRVETPAPAGAILKEAGGVLKVGKEVVEAEATLRVELIKPGWHEIPLGLSDAGVTRATIDGAAARLISRPGQGYALLLEKAEGPPSEVLLAVNFARAYERTPGRNRVAFHPPPAAVSRWEVVIPEPGVKAEVTPLLATSEAPAASTNETRIVAVVGAAPQVAIQWTPRAEGAVGLDALVNLHTESDTEIDEGVVRTRLTLRYTISRAKLPRVEFDLPAGQKVVAVVDANVKEWKIAPAAGSQRVQVEFFEPAGGTQSVQVEMESYGTQTEVAVPFPKGSGVSRQQGVAGVRVSPRLRAEIGKRAGLTQVDESTLPRPASGGTYPFAFQYSQAEGAELVFRVEAVAPRILAESVNRVRIEPDRVEQEVLLRWKVEKAGVFKLRVRLPSGFEFDSVAGHAPQGGSAPRVEGHFIEQGVLTLNLAAQALGEAAARVALSRKLDLPALRQPGAGEATLDLPLAVADAEGVETQKGLVELWENPALQRMRAEAEGLEFRGRGEAEAEAPWVQSLSGRAPQGGWFFRGHGSPSLKVTLRRREPYLAVGQLLEAAIESGRVQYRATFGFDVSYSGVKLFRIDVPEGLAGQIKLSAQNLRLRPASADEAANPPTPPGYARLVIEGDNEFIGRVPAPLEWNEKAGELPVGQSIEIALPRLAPVGVNHAWGQIVLKKAEAIDLIPSGDPGGLRPIDPERDLMDNRRIPGAAQAYEFRTPDWSLKVRATRYEAAEVKNTSIERGWVRQVLTRSGAVSVQAVYRLRSARQRLAIGLPETAEFDAQPSRINGAPVSLERGQRGEFFVPLTGRSPDDPFVLELRYTLPDKGRRLEIPEFKGEPAVQKVMQSVYLPPDRRYLGFAGPWSDENVWVVLATRMHKRAMRTPDALIAWVVDGVAVDTSAIAQFPTDGVHLLFSALRPEAGEAGSLRVRSMTGWLLDGLVLALILGAGVPLLRAPPRKAILAAAVAACAWAVGMVFRPELAGAMLNQATGTAVLVVGGLWLVRQLVSGEWRINLPKRPRPPAPPKPPENPPPPAPPAAPAAPATAPAAADPAQPEA